MESVVIVLLVVAVASAYPYSPYTDPKGESSNVKLSEEAVAAYLKNKMEDEKLEPAKIMNYVESLLQGGGKGGKTQSKWLVCMAYQPLFFILHTHCVHLCCLSHFEYGVPTLVLTTLI